MSNKALAGNQLNSANCLNMDANASFGLLPEVKEGLQTIFGVDFGLNPSSIHSGGQKARYLIEQARESLADLLGINKEAKIIFTSGATEANNSTLLWPYWSALSTGRSSASKPPRLLVSALEHPSVLEPAKRLEALGVDLDIVYPNESGTFEPAQFVSLCEEETRMLSIMLANNETGRIFPVRDIARAVKELFPQVIVHTDAVQALGKLDLTFGDLEVDAISLSGHKIGALSGIGALVVRSCLDYEAFCVGGPQETRRRAGTENIIGIVSFGLAAQELLRNLKRRRTEMLENKIQLAQALKHAIPNLIFNSDIESDNSSSIWLPNTLNLRFPGIKADDLVVALDLAGILISAGAACASGKPEPSPVLLALGLTSAEAAESVRISLRGTESKGDLDRAVSTISRAVMAMQTTGNVQGVMCAA